jgi:hypothetical protein
MFERIARRLVTWVVVLAIAYALVVYVWPTRYRYDHILTGNEDYPVRIDRLTGEGEMLTPDDGWVPMGPGADDESIEDRSRTS